MKTLITHINPHLDDIAAIWLFKKFHPDFKDSKLEFIPARMGNLPHQEDDDHIYLGVGRGRFDEHKGDIGECATSLVWKFLKEQKLVPEKEAEILALDQLIEWVRKADTGKLGEDPYGDFSMPAFIRVHKGGKFLDSEENTDLGSKILDRIFLNLTHKQQAQLDWQKVLSFETKWGKGYAIESEYVDRSVCNSKDGAIYIMVDPDQKSVQFYTPKDGVDLEEIYNKVKELDPNAGWFLHHSHHILLCRSGASPDDTPTKLSIDQLIEVARAV